MTISLGIILAFILGAGIGAAISWFLQKAKIKAVEDQTVLFESLSSKALKENNQAFLDLAKQKFETLQTKAEGDLEQRKQAVASMMEPVKSTLEKFEKQIHEIENKREGAYSGLSQQIDYLQKTNRDLKTETTNLVQALRSSSQVRGSWGEYQLKNILELAGMTQYCDFQQQSSTTTTDGRLRPDVVIKLPNKGNIVVDAKTPLMNFGEDEKANPEVTKQKLQTMARQVRTHMQNLSKKSYWETFQPSPDFVILFLPKDEMYNIVLEQDPDLYEASVKSKVIIATPSNLIAILRCVAIGWQQVRIAKEAGEIAKLGKELYERISSMATHFADLGKKLGGAVDAYNKTVASVETRMLPTARKFQDLQQMGEVPTLQLLEQDPRELQAEELRTSTNLNIVSNKI